MRQNIRKVVRFHWNSKNEAPIVVLGGFVSGVVDAAAGHNHHVAVGPDVEVVVDQLVQPGLGDDCLLYTSRCV